MSFAGPGRSAPAQSTHPVHSTASSSGRTPSAVRSEAVVSTWEAAGSWSGPVKPIEQPPVAPLPADITPSRINIADAIRAYLANRAGSGIVPATLRKRRTFAKQVGEFAAARGYVMLDQLRSIDVDVFYGNWQLGREDSSHERLEAPLGARRAANKVPFTDEELHCIIRACDQPQPIPWSNGKTGGVWTGDDVKDFIWVTRLHRAAHLGRRSVQHKPPAGQRTIPPCQKEWR
jgi:hypothetical protein